MVTIPATILRSLALTPGVPAIHSLVAVLLMDAMARTPILAALPSVRGLAQASS